MGECYVDELKDAAALLGPLSSSWRVQVDANPTDKEGIFRFLNTETGDLHDEDPRISGLHADFGMSKEYVASVDTRYHPSQSEQMAGFSRSRTQADIRLRSFVLE